MNQEEINKLNLMKLFIEKSKEGYKKLIVIEDKLSNSEIFIFLTREEIVDDVVNYYNELGFYNVKKIIGYDDNDGMNKIRKLEKKYNTY